MGQSANRSLLVVQQQNDVANLQQSPQTETDLFMHCSNTAGTTDNANYSQKQQQQRRCSVASLHSVSTSSRNLTGCFKCNHLFNLESQQTPLTEAETLAKTDNITQLPNLQSNNNHVNLRHNNNGGIFKKMRQRIRSSINRLSSPITLLPTDTDTTDHARATGTVTTTVCRSQTDYSLVKLNDLSDSSNLIIQCNEPQPSKPLRSNFKKSPAIYNIYNQQNDDTVKISDLLEDNESLSSYDYDTTINNTQQQQQPPYRISDKNNLISADNTLTSAHNSSSPTSSSSCSFSHSQKKQLHEQQQSATFVTCDSLCYIDELIDDDNDGNANDSDNENEDTLNEVNDLDESRTSESSLSLHSSADYHKNNSFINQLNKKLIQHCNQNHHDVVDEYEQLKLKRPVDYYLDWEANRNNDNISIYNQCFYYMPPQPQPQYQPQPQSALLLNRQRSLAAAAAAPLASSETTTLSGSITQLNTSSSSSSSSGNTGSTCSRINHNSNSYSIIKRIKI